MSSNDVIRLWNLTQTENYLLAHNVTNDGNDDEVEKVDWRVSDLETKFDERGIVNWLKK